MAPKKRLFLGQSTLFVFPEYQSARKASVMRLRFTLLAITLCALIVSACDTEPSPVTAIIVDFPHGALRLLVQRDGETRLFYGALPTHRAVKSDTFNIDDLFRQLQPRLHDNVSAENRPIGQPYGMVTIEFNDGSGQDYLIYDEAFAAELFQTACANLLEEEMFRDEVVTTACAKIVSTAP